MTGPRRRPRHRATGLVVALGAAVLGVCTVNAQPPTAPQDDRVPSVGISLRPGWQLLIHDGCQFAVPGSWRPDPAGDVAAPDGSNVSVRRFRIASWSAHKAQIRAAYGQVRVLHEDSDRRLWFEIGDAQRTQHYIDVTNGVSTCTALLEIHLRTPSAAEDTTNSIADSIGAARDTRPDAK